MTNSSVSSETDLFQIAWLAASSTLFSLSCMRWCEEVNAVTLTLTDSNYTIATYLGKLSRPGQRHSPHRASGAIQLVAAVQHTPNSLPVITDAPSDPTPTRQFKSRPSKLHKVLSDSNRQNLYFCTCTWKSAHCVCLGGQRSRSNVHLVGHCLMVP